MKKLFLMVIGVVALLSTNVDAMTEKELQQKLTKEYTINGVSFKLDSSYVSQVERYLNENEVSSKDADYISKKVDEVVKVIESGNAKDIKSLSKSEKDKLKNIASEISSNTDVNVTVAKGGEVTVYNTDGTVFTKVSEPIKYTDNNTLIISLTTVAILASGVVLIKKFA